LRLSICLWARRDSKLTASVQSSYRVRDAHTVYSDVSRPSQRCLKASLLPSKQNRQHGDKLRTVYLFVGEEGLEPSILTELVPKTSAYTNSATRPYFDSITAFWLAEIQEFNIYMNLGFGLNIIE
jgi:hypothetical protein